MLLYPQVAKARKQTNSPVPAPPLSSKAVSGFLAGGANPREDSLMVMDLVAGLLFGHLPGQDRDRHIDIDQLTANDAVDVVMSISTPVEPRGVVTEREFLDQPALCQEMQRPVNRAVRDRRLLAPHALEDPARSQMPHGILHLGEGRQSLRCQAKSALKHLLRLAPM